jgi:hypothetical protein
LLLTAFAFPAIGQEATLVGTVTDPSDALVPNVAITIVNAETAQARHTHTNDAGQFVAPDLHIGHYSVRAESIGFATAERKDLVLNVGDHARVDFKLELGSKSDSVNIEGRPLAVQSESGEISDVITGQQVSQLDANGRSIYSLVTLTPGASSNMVDFQVPIPVLGSDSAVSFNGLRVSHNLYMVDGGEDYDRGGSGFISIMPSLDSIAEFRVLTSNYSPEYGLSSAGTVAMAFKSGTRDFHATAWEFLRNDALDAGNFFTKAANLKAPELRFNTYGFNTGGPVTFGKLYNKDRSKSFFFFNMEWRKLVQGDVINQTVPLPSEYGGQFDTPINVPSASQLSPSMLARYTALGLTPGQPFPNNQIAASLLDPNAQVLLKAGIFPAPNYGAQFLGGNNVGTGVREEIARIGQQISEKFWIFGHWVDEQIHQSHGTSQWSHGNVPTASSVFSNPSYSGVIHATYAVSPTLLNETSLNYSGNRISFVPQGIVTRPSNLNIPELFAGNSMNRIPSIELWGSTGTRYDVGTWPGKNSGDDYQIRNDVSWTKGAHQLKFGGSWAIYKKVQDFGGYTQGSFAFSGSYTGNDFADFLLGYSNFYSELATPNPGYWDNVSWAAYVQDNWRINSRLTLNLGLRWDGIPHTYEERNRVANFYPGLYDQANAAIFVPGSSGNAINPDSPGLGASSNPILNGIPFYLNGIGVAGQNGIPRGLVKDSWAAFGPRVGFAFDLTGRGKTVVRGGFGILYERMQGNDMYNAGANQPFNTNVTFTNVSLSNPKLSLLSGEILTPAITTGNITGLAYNDYKLPASYQYSAGIQQGLGQRSVVSISYVGNQNRHQNDLRDINVPSTSVLPALINGTVAYNTVLPYPGFHSIVLSEDTQNSHYNSLQVNLRAQVKNDLSLQFAYTLSRAIDPGGSYDLNQVSNPYNRAYDIGPSALDRTHITVANFIYQLPFFNRSPNRLAKSTLGGWEMSGIVTAETGLPLQINLGGSQWNNGLANGVNRPNWNGSISYPHTIAQWFDPASFSTPAIGAWGNLPSGMIRSPGRDNWNVALFKSFLFSERRNSHLEFRVETFNTFNHTQFNNISNWANFASDRKTVVNNFGAVTSVWDPRVFQIALKLLF